jgi:NADH-quinone oxidoreductase subunit G
VLSAQHSSEDNCAAVLFARALGTDKLYLAGHGGWQADKVLRSGDNNPNRAGALQVAGKAVPALSALLAAVAQGEISAVVALGSACAESVAALMPLRALAVVSLSSNLGPLGEVAAVVVPVAGHGEAAGSFVNDKGLNQRFDRAVAPPPDVLPAWGALGEVARAMGIEPGFSTLSDLRAKLGTPTAAPAEARV